MSKPTLFQKIQDYFCRANRVYLSCLNREDGVITQIPRSVISRLTPAPSFPWTGRCIFDLQKPL